MKREALSHPLAIAGAVIATASAAVFIALLVAMLIGFLENPYAGLVVFIAIPALFVAGLLLIPAGAWLQHRRLQRDPTAVAEWPVVDFRRAQVRRTALMLAFLTVINAAIVLLAGYGSLHWMESPSFCGQVCHTPMQPQFTTWHAAAHGRVACVECHIGEGAAGFIHAKLNGVRQLMHVAINSYPRPVPPGAKMPVGSQRKNCLSCHEPQRFAGDRIRVIREYADDEANTEALTVLQMHVGGPAASGRAIHWHVNPAIRVEYVATDERRQTIPYVRVTDANGHVKEYTTADAGEQAASAGERHTMECADCHNRVGHPVAQTAERAVDEAIAAGAVSRKLPFVRREAVRLLKAHANDADVPAIERDLGAFYDAQHGSIDQGALAQSVAAIGNVHRRNVFPRMKVTFGTYPTNLGHMTSDGCFRCHDGNHAAKDGSTINNDCEYCHRQIEAPSGT